MINDAWWFWQSFNFGLPLVLCGLFAIFPSAGDIARSYTSNSRRKPGLRPIAAAVGMSVDEYLEALIGKLPAEADEPPFQGGQFQREHGLWVYRIGDPMPASLGDDTSNAIRREREAKLLGNTPE